MTQWATFAGLAGVVLALLLALSHLTQSTLDASEDRPANDDRFAVDDDPDRRSSEPTGAVTADAPEDASEAVENGGSEAAGFEIPGEDGVGEDRRDDRLETDLSTGMLLANVALSQGVFAAVLVAAAVYAAVPTAALGVEFSASYLFTGLVVGTAVGVVLYAFNELGSASADRLGFDHDEELRELLAPDSRRGWFVLLFGVLPLIAFFEEFLFRAALIGALSVGFGLSPWLLAVLSSAAFALGHGVQGRVGIAVTGALGFVLAAVFIYTGSLLVVVVAHYLINALEFVVHEGLGVEWGETTGS